MLLPRSKVTREWLVFIGCNRDWRALRYAPIRVHTAIIIIIIVVVVVQRAWQWGNIVNANNSLG